MSKLSKAESRRLDEAARAGWLYYVAGKTQDEIAKILTTSRQTAQRLVALSVSSGLVKVRLDHPIAHCMTLSKKLQDRFNLLSCEVVPSLSESPNSTFGLSQAGAAEIERQLISDTPKIIAMGTGRVLRACIDELSSLSCPQHRIVSLVGNMASDGSASQYDVVIHMAERIKSNHYPMPLPVIASGPDERAAWQQQPHIANVFNQAKQADVILVGIGNLGEKSPLHIDGFISKSELQQLTDLGAVGEVISWIFNKDGNVINCDFNQRVASVPLDMSSSKPVIGIAAGEDKVIAILGALRSKLINSLITNEYTAQRLLDT
jgi:DNA-binding transcriptional regulator LsrR (DeoR family)